MPDDNDRDSEGGRLWAGLRSLIFGNETEPTLRDQIEEAIEDHEDEAPAKGDLSGPERQMLRNLLDFGDRTAGDVGVPRSDIVAVPETIAFAELVAAFADAGHSRLPVYRGSLDEVIGMIHVKDVFAILARGDAAPDSVEPLIRQPRYVPESMGVLDLLAEMRATRTHLAIVLDEYSGTEGLVTIEDIVEEIVGEIEDEHDDEPEAMLVPLDDGVWSADARVELKEVAELIDPRLAEIAEDVDTLGGMATVLAGHVPQAGEIVPHASGWRIEVIEAAPRRVQRIRLHPPLETAPDA
jgi:CBS domain containing-hemolysin-like protein